ERRVVADERVGEAVGAAVAGARAADAERCMPVATEVLHRRQRSGVDHAEPGESEVGRGHDRSTNLTRAPGTSRAGGSRSRSNTLTRACPISCQPPGDSRGYTPVNSPARASDPAGTLVRGLG